MYPEEFRAEAVRLVGSSDGTIREMADDFGVSSQTLRDWVIAAKVDAGERWPEHRRARGAAVAASARARAAAGAGGIAAGFLEALMCPRV